jgi:hypothetical protein
MHYRPRVRALNIGVVGFGVAGAASAALLEA